LVKDWQMLLQVHTQERLTIAKNNIKYNLGRYVNIGIIFLLIPDISLILLPSQWISKYLNYKTSMKLHSNRLFGSVLLFVEL